MRLLITGATGFLGRHVLTALAAAPSRPRLVLLLRDRAGWEALAWRQALPASLAIELVEGGLEDLEAIVAACGAVDAILHLAAVVRHSRQAAAAVFAANVNGTCAMVHLASRLKARLVYVSTSGTVGCARDPGARPAEAAPHCLATVSRWPYYSSKVAAERQASALAASLAVQLVIVRPPMLLGPGDHRLRATGQVTRFLRGRVPFLLAGGIHYCDVRDAAAALVTLLEHPAPRPIYHLTGTACSLQQFFADLSALTEIPAPRHRLPQSLIWVLAQADAWLGRRLRGAPLGLLPDPVVVEMAAHHWGLASSYAELDLNYASRAPECTLRDTIDWLRAHHPRLQPSSVQQGAA